MGLTLRHADEADLPLLAQMNKHLIEDEKSRNPMTVAQLQERMRGWLSEDYAVRLFVDESAQGVGYAVYRVLPDDYDPDRQYVYLRQFFIRREMRRCGLGTQALALLRDEFPVGATVALDVLTSNPAGQAFWASVGFSPYCMTMHLADRRR